MGTLRPCPPVTAASLVLGLCSACLTAAPALAQSDPSGITFVTVGAAGNPGYNRVDPTGQATGRGAVNYDFRIGQYETTARQWAEFMNAALNRPDPVPWVEVPGEWPGGRSAPFGVSQSNAMRPVGGVTWRTCAIFTNWLCNDKRLDQAAFMTGAYDVSTFGYDDHGLFTDQRAHTPGARYWIPTLDEWMKAAYFDPQKLNDDGTVGGWWTYANRLDRAPIYGMPGSLGGTAEANAGFVAQGEAQFNVRLGSYEVTSPWGLYDTAGETSEYTESVYHSPGHNLDYRIFMGSAWATSTGSTPGARDAAWFPGGDVFPSEHDYAYGFRIAAAVPSSPTALIVAVGVCCTQRRRRGKAPCLGPTLSYACSCS